MRCCVREREVEDSCAARWEKRTALLGGGKEVDC